MTTAIEWTDETWNPITGCSAISEGCANCYAKRMANRLKGRCGYDARNPFRVTLHFKRLMKPLEWREPRRVFVCSMGDMFHDQVPFGFIAKLFATFLLCQRHTFQVLTKRPHRMREFFDWLRTPAGRDKWLKAIVSPPDGDHEEWTRRWPLPNVWLGVTAENQARADERIPLLLQTPAAVRFVSVEPMLGPVDMDFGIPPGAKNVDWVICGAETGPGARPMYPDWAIDLRGQCNVAGVPFFFKKWSKGTDLDIEMPREWPEMPR